MDNKPRMIRWTAPLGAAAMIAVGAIALSPSAQADPALPPRTAEELVADVLAAEHDTYSGTVSTTSELGLPDLSGLGEGGGIAQQLLTGSHTARVWADGADKQRLALPDGNAETVAIRNGDTGWLWSSAEQTATRLDTSESGQHTQKPSGTPAELARTVLAEVGKTSKVTTSSTSTVADRAAYDLVVQPTQQGTKIDKVVIAIDGVTHLPLQVQVFGVGVAEPSIEVGFTDISFTRPDAKLFEFTPPPGATVEDAPDHEKHGEPGTKGDDRSGKPGKDVEPTVTGDGWVTVAVTDLGENGDREDQQAQIDALLGQLPEVSGSWGRGRLFEGPLFSAVITDDGRVAAGAVTPDLLYAALS
ncbi:LolA family protein [Propionibacteriaceae bacterium Y1685]